MVILKILKHVVLKLTDLHTNVQLIDVVNYKTKFQSKTHCGMALRQMTCTDQDGIGIWLDIHHFDMPIPPCRPEKHNIVLHNRKWRSFMLIAVTPYKTIKWNGHTCTELWPSKVIRYLWEYYFLLCKSFR